MEAHRIRNVLIASTVCLAVFLCFDTEHALAEEASPRVSPYPEVDKRIAQVDIPKSVLAADGPMLTVPDIERTATELRRHEAWVQQVIEEYKWVMTTDPAAKEYYQKLCEAQAELHETLAAVDAKEGELREIFALQEKLIRAGADRDFVAARIDMLLEQKHISHLREVRANLAQVYTAAHQMSFLGTNGYVWVDGAPKSIADIFGFDFLQDNERNIPRRPARAFYEFFRVMNKETGWYPLFTEGHTGDAAHPTSYSGHVSSEHKTGVAADIIPRSGSITDDGAYRILMGGKDNEYFRIRFEPGSDAAAKRLIDSFSARAVQDGHFKTVEAAHAWFHDRISHSSAVFDEHGRQVKGTTGQHFHVVGLGGLGAPLDPNGPPKSLIASR